MREEHGVEVVAVLAGCGERTERQASLKLPPPLLLVISPGVFLVPPPSAKEVDKSNHSESDSDIQALIKEPPSVSEGAFTFHFPPLPNASRHLTAFSFSCDCGPESRAATERRRATADHHQRRSRDVGGLVNTQEAAGTTSADSLNRQNKRIHLQQQIYTAKLAPEKSASQHVRQIVPAGSRG